MNSRIREGIGGGNSEVATGIQFDSTVRRMIELISYLAEQTKASIIEYSIPILPG
jgi:hypothetical protein